MFSHLCRVCLKQFNNSLDIIPIFEPHENVLYCRIFNELKLLVRIYDVKLVVKRMYLTGMVFAGTPG